MSKCPVCNAPVMADFGLAECAQCGAQLLIHADGHVEHSQADEAPAGLEVQEQDSEDFPFIEAPSEDSAPLEFDAFAAEISAEEAKPEPQPEPEPEPSSPSEPASEESQELMGDQPEVPAAVYKTPSTSDSPDLSDIASFGNSENLSRDGSLRYNLFISGIDTVDIREAFREAVTDRKFMWDTDEILRSIHHGEVEIENITPVKAYVLISRLRSLPVQIKWEQYAIHQT